MSDWGQEVLPARPVFQTNIEEWVRRTGIAPTYASVSTGYANVGVYCPVWVEHQFTVKKLYCLNGATPAGNVQMSLLGSGIWDVGYMGQLYPDFNPATNSAIVAQAGSNIWQAFDIPDTIVTPGMWWLGWSAESASAQIQAVYSFTAGGGEAILGGLFGTAFPIGHQFSVGGVTFAMPILAMGGIA